MSSQWQFCAICGRPLERVNGREWTHSRVLLGGEDEDHVVIPVDADQIRPVLRCDICDEEPVAYEVNARPFDYPPPAGMQRSLGGWGLCVACAPVLEAAIASRNVAGLVDRAVLHQPEAHRPWLLRLYGRLLTHVSSPVSVIPPEGGRYGSKTADG